MTKQHLALIGDTMEAIWFSYGTSKKVVDSYMRAKLEMFCVSQASAIDILQVKIINLLKTLQSSTLKKGEKNLREQE